MTLPGKVSNLADEGAQAIQGLLRSLDPSVTPDQLSARINELVGDDGANGVGAELLNEDGLPILDINEPATDNAPEPGYIPLEADIIPIARLSPEERERRRAETQRILDELEEEERLELSRVREAAFERRKEAALQQQENAKKEAERLRSAREVQKRMGKALMKSIGDQKKLQEAERVPEEPPKPSTSKKSVSFATVPDEPEQAAEDWGDVTPGRLRPEMTMKSTVVERIPSSPRYPQRAPDSDDESDPSDASSGSDIDNTLEEDDYDLDQAQHHREIALEYYRQRDKIAATTTELLSQPSELPDIADDETQPNGRVKPSVSQFRATQVSNSYSMASGAAILPVTAAKTLQKSIRMGKLVGEDQLAAGDDDHSEEEDEEDEAVKEVIELLKKGMVENAGPELSVASSSSSGVLSTPLKPLAPKPGTSKFKLDRSQAVKHTVKNPSPLNPAVQVHSAPVMPSMIVESPSFPPPVAAAGPVPLVVNPSPISRRPERPPTVMTTSVRESTNDRAVAPPNQPPKRVSRFMADRM